MERRRLSLIAGFTLTAVAALGCRGNDNPSPEAATETPQSSHLPTETPLVVAIKVPSKYLGYKTQMPSDWDLGTEPQPDGGYYDYFYRDYGRQDSPYIRVSSGIALKTLDEYADEWASSLGVSQIGVGPLIDGAESRIIDIVNPNDGYREIITLVNKNGKAYAFDLVASLTEFPEIEAAADLIVNSVDFVDPGDTPTATPQLTTVPLPLT